MFSSFCLFNYCTVRAFPLTCYVYGVVWRLEARTFQTNTNYIKCNTLEFSTIRQMIYTLCCMLVFILQSQSVSSFNKFNSFLINLHRR